MQLAHVGLAAAEDRTVYASDEAWCSCCAIDATRVICTWHAKGYMVEDVEGLKLELPLHSLRHLEVFEQGSIREVV